MQKAGGKGALAESDLMSLEQYAKNRDAFRASVLAHKCARTVAVGPNMTWVFEDRLTIQYQVQEMLRIERIFEVRGIREELEAYNPLIPDGGNWKATMMIEYADANERRDALQAMIGIEDRVWVRVAGHAPLVPHRGAHQDAVAGGAVRGLGEPVGEVRRLVAGEFMEFGDAWVHIA